MVACYLLCPWLSQAVRDTELKSKGLYFRLLYLLWHSYGVDSLPICSWSRNLLFDKREDWGFYLSQPFPSWFPSPAGILCRSFTSSHGFGIWPPLQWFFQLLNKRRQTDVSLLTPGEFGLHPYVTPLCPGAWLPSLHWQMNVVVCSCWSATQEVKKSLGFFYKSVSFSLKNSHVSYLTAGLCLQSPAWVQSSAQGSDQWLFRPVSVHDIYYCVAEACRQCGVLPYPRSNSI